MILPTRLCAQFFCKYCGWKDMTRKLTTATDITSPTMALFFLLFHPLPLLPFNNRPHHHHLQSWPHLSLPLALHLRLCWQRNPILTELVDYHHNNNNNNTGNFDSLLCYTWHQDVVEASSTICRPSTIYHYCWIGISASIGWDISLTELLILLLLQLDVYVCVMDVCVCRVVATRIYIQQKTTQPKYCRSINNKHEWHEQQREESC